MGSATRELVEALAVLSENHNLRVSVQSSVQGAAITGGITLLGGLLGGRPGIAVGGAIGSILAYAAGNDSHKSVAVIIRDEFTDEQKHEICHHIVNALRSIHPVDIAGLASLLLQGRLREEVLEEIKNFFNNQLSMQIL